MTQSSRFKAYIGVALILLAGALIILYLLYNPQDNPPIHKPWLENSP